MNILSIWAEAIRYRWRGVLIIAGIVMGAVLLYLAVAPRTYVATATLFFDSDSPNPLEEAGQQQPSRDRGLSTETDILRSTAVAQQVVRDLSLTRDSGLQAEWKESGAQIPLDQWLAQWVKQSVAVENDGNTRVIAVRASSSTPQRAAELANGYANASTAKLLDLKTSAASDYLRWLQEEIAQSEDAVATAEGRLREFVAVTGISNNGDLNAEASRSANIAVESAVAQARAAGTRNLGGVTPYAASEAER